MPGGSLWALVRPPPPWGRLSRVVGWGCVVLCGPRFLFAGSRSVGHHLAVVVSSMRFGLACLALPSLPPRDWLQCRQMMRALATLSSPP